MPHPSLIAIAHRGASAYAPENTVAAFDEAIRRGAAAVEIDLRLSSDGIPVIVHDETLDRTTNAHGPVTAFTHMEMRRFDAGSWMHPRFTGTRIPTLDEALAAIHPAAIPVIELKVPIDPQLLEYILRRHQAEENALVISFEPKWLLEIRKFSPKIDLGLLAEHFSDLLPDACDRLDASVLIMDARVLTMPIMEKLLDRGLEVWTYTANDMGLVAACAALGVTGIITDKPDLIRVKAGQD